MPTFTQNASQIAPKAFPETRAKQVATNYAQMAPKGSPKAPKTEPGGASCPNFCQQKMSKSSKNRVRARPGAPPGSQKRRPGLPGPQNEAPGSPNAPPGTQKPPYFCQKPIQKPIQSTPSLNAVNHMGAAVSRSELNIYERDVENAEHQGGLFIEDRSNICVP